MPWVPSTESVTFELAKNVVHIVCVLAFKQITTKRNLFIAIASSAESEITFDVFNTISSIGPIHQLNEACEHHAPRLNEACVASLEKFKENFEAHPPVTNIKLSYYGTVLVNVDVHVNGSSKHFVTNIDIEPLPSPLSLDKLAVAYADYGTGERLSEHQDTGKHWPPKSPTQGLWSRVKRIVATAGLKRSRTRSEG